MLRVLVVENNDLIRTAMREELEGLFEVLETGNSDEAFAKARECKPDALLLGMSVSEDFGLKLREAIAPVNELQEIPIFAINGGANAKSAAGNPGAIQFIERPIDFDKLRTRLSVALQIKAPDRRREIRVLLNTVLKLRGTDKNGAKFEQNTTTENVSQNGFFCGCLAALEKNSIVEVFMGRNGSHRVGTARLMRTELQDPSHPRYGFRFEVKDSQWILG